MSQPAFVSVASVRDYLALNSSDSTSKYTDGTIGSNIRAASWFLQRATGRQFENVTETRSFTTNALTSMSLPGLRTATSVTLAGSALTANQTYYLIPDVQQSGVYVAIQFRAFERDSGGSPWWYGKRDWFDRGYDLPFGPGSRSSLPNDLVIVGLWGYSDLPEPLLHATKVLAAWYTLRPNAMLSGAYATPDGNAFDLSALPVEVGAFVTEWRLGGMVASA